MVLKTLESPLDCKEIQRVHPKGDKSWVFIGRTDAEAETPILWQPHVKSWLIGKDPDAGGEGDDRGWDGWVASPTWWAWVWVNFRSWWWTGRPGVLQFMGSQGVGHNRATEPNWTETFFILAISLFHLLITCVFSGGALLISLKNLYFAKSGFLFGARGLAFSLSQLYTQHAFLTKLNHF